MATQERARTSNQVSSLQRERIEELERIRCHLENLSTKEHSVRVETREQQATQEKAKEAENEKTEEETVFKEKEDLKNNGNIIKIRVRPYRGKEAENEKTEEETVFKEKEDLKAQIGISQGLVLECLKSWLNDLIGSEIVCLQEEVSKEELQHMVPLTIEKIFELSRQVVQFEEADDFEGGDDAKGKFVLTVKTISDKETIHFKVRESYRIGQIKEIIEDKLGYAPDLQRLYCGNTIMEDTQKLKDYNIKNTSVINLILLRRGLNCPTYYINPALFDLDFNFNFIGIKDKEKFYRGGREYVRPLGSQRFALKVLGKYKTDLWLGSTGKFTGSEGEWPVAYHGTTESNALKIAECGFDLSKCKRFLYGRGLYSTPCPETARLYAQEFTFGKNQFELIFQVRVDPEKLVVGKKNTTDGEYWILPEGDSMRAYGICMFPVD